MSDALKTTTIAMSPELLRQTLAKISKHLDRCISAADMTADYTDEDEEWQRQYLRDGINLDIIVIANAVAELRDAAKQPPSEG